MDSENHRAARVSDGSACLQAMAFACSIRIHISRSPNHGALHADLQQLGWISLEWILSEHHQSAS